MLELTQAQIDRFADYKARYLPRKIASGPAFRASIAQKVEAILRLAAAETCLQRKAHFESALDPDAFRERVLVEEGAKVAIGGIRFRNLDPGFPFIEVTSNFNLLEPSLSLPVLTIAAQQFAGFAPRGLLLAGPAGVTLAMPFERWTHVVAGASAQACAAVLPTGLSCSFPAKVDFYDAYHTAYSQWRASSPGLAPFVRIEPGQSMGEAAAAGLLASFHDARGWCGVVGAREEAFYGTPAMYIFELFLVERWRGRRAGRAIDAALVCPMAERYPVVWEHIHAGNLPSLRTALAQGRSIVETEYFLPFPT